MSDADPLVEGNTRANLQNGMGHTTNAITKLEIAMDTLGIDMSEPMPTNPFCLEYQLRDARARLIEARNELKSEAYDE